MNDGSAPAMPPSVLALPGKPGLNGPTIQVQAFNGALTLHDWYAARVANQLVYDYEDSDDDLDAKTKFVHRIAAALVRNRPTDEAPSTPLRRVNGRGEA